MHELAPPERLTIGEATVVTGATDHQPVEPTIGYRIEHDGTAVVIAGDGVPCAGLDELCAGADAYVQTGHPRRPRQARPERPPAGHPRLPLDDRAGRPDRGPQRRAARWWRTHFVPAIFPGFEHEWRDLAAAHFDGEIVLAEDLMDDRPWRRR